MGVMKTAAVKGIIPSGSKVSELRSNLMRLMTEMPIVLEERFGEAGLKSVAEIFERLGEEDATAMKDRLGFGNTLRDSHDAWVVVGHIMGAKMNAEWVSDDRIEFPHQPCPQYEAFKKRGKPYCDSVRLSYVSAVGKTGDSVETDVVKAADDTGPCIKGLSISK
jgi:hypothetical protein